MKITGDIYFDIHDNENVYLTVPKAGKKKKDKDNRQREVPPELRTPEAEPLLKSLEADGLLEADAQPAKGLSLAQKGVVANELARQLSIQSYWKVFGKLWGMNPETLRRSYNRALEQRSTANFIDRLKKAVRGGGNTEN